MSVTVPTAGVHLEPRLFTREEAIRSGADAPNIGTRGLVRAAHHAWCHAVRTLGGARSPDGAALRTSNSAAFVVVARLPVEHAQGIANLRAVIDLGLAAGSGADHEVRVRTLQADGTQIDSSTTTFGARALVTLPVETGLASAVDTAEVEIAIKRVASANLAIYAWTVEELPLAVGDL